MSFLPGSLTPASLRSCHRKVISHSDGHSVVGCRKNKKSQLLRASEIDGSRKRSLYWLGHLGAIYQRVLEKFLISLSYTSRRIFQIRTLLNIFFDPVFQGVLCHNLNGWLFIFQVVAYGIGRLGSDFRKISPSGSRRKRHF